MISFERVSKRFETWNAVTEVSFNVAAGEICVLLGTSGAGKSTVLRLVNRLIEPTEGQVRVRGQPVQAQPPEVLRRQIGYVIQSVGLFPHWTVARNIATVPRLLGWTTAAIEARVTELFALLRLDGAALAGRYPHELSGGQQQRVGVARALAARPDILLMDEPFGALDPVTRAGLQDELLRVQRETGCTILFVTHDLAEALRLGNRVGVMDRGRLLQLAPPRQLLTDPADAFVRDFIGPETVGLRLLALGRAADRLHPGSDAAALPQIAADLPLDRALSVMLAAGVERLGVVDAAGRPLGTLHWADLLARQ